MKIYDALGRLIKVLVEAYQASANYEVIWDSTDLNGKAVASGIYFYKIQAGDFKQTRKMALMMIRWAYGVEGSVYFLVEQLMLFFTLLRSD